MSRLPLSLCVLRTIPCLWALTGTRRRVTLRFTTLRLRAIRAYPFRGSRALHRRHLQTAEFRRPHESPCRLGSSRRQPPMRMFFFADYRPVVAPCRYELTTPSRLTGTTTAIGRTRGRRGRHVQRTDGIHRLPTSTRITNLVRCAPSLLTTDPWCRRYGKTKGTGGRQTGNSPFLGILDPHEVRSRVCWQAISTALGMWSACRKARAFATTSLWRRTLTCSPNTATLCSSTRTPSSPTTRACRSSSLASSGMPHGPSRAWLLLATSAELPTSRALLHSSQDHISNECAKRRSVCIVLLLLDPPLVSQARRSCAYRRQQQGCRA